MSLDGRERAAHCDVSGRLPVQARSGHVVPSDIAAGGSGGCGYWV